MNKEKYTDEKVFMIEPVLSAYEPVILATPKSPKDMNQRQRRKLIRQNPHLRNKYAAR